MLRFRHQGPAGVAKVKVSALSEQKSLKECALTSGVKMRMEMV